MSAIFGKILLMPHAASHRPNIDQLRSAVASMGGASPVLELLLAELEATREERDSLRKEKHSNTLEIERLSLLLEKFKRLLFGRKSEKLLRQIEQLELELEEAYINEGVRQELEQARKRVAPAARPSRQPLPDHLPRETHEHLPAEAQCPDCGGAWKRLRRRCERNAGACAGALPCGASRTPTPDLLLL